MPTIEPINLDDKLEFLTRKIGLIDLIGLGIKVAILWYYESALSKERERKAMIAIQKNELEALNKVEHAVNKPPVTSGDSVTL